MLSLIMYGILEALHELLSHEIYIKVLTKKNILFLENQKIKLINI